VKDWLDEVPWNEHGLVAAIAQDAASGKVLTLAWMNREALASTVQRGEAVYWSRSRNKLWRKGEQSGHVLKVRELLVDCDNDTVLIRAEALGPGVCHEGYRSCFFRKLNADGSTEIVSPRMFDPADVYKEGKKP
jgi:phosphoribosyl-AMP cyclohydrolase